MKINTNTPMAMVLSTGIGITACHKAPDAPRYQDDRVSAAVENILQPLEERASGYPSSDCKRLYESRMHEGQESKIPRDAVRCGSKELSVHEQDDRGMRYGYDTRGRVYFVFPGLDGKEEIASANFVINESDISSGAYPDKFSVFRSDKVMRGKAINSPEMLISSVEPVQLAVACQESLVGPFDFQCTVEKDGEKREVVISPEEGIRLLKRIRGSVRKALSWIAGNF